ncbi:NFX1-type zinc finger-containing protein 1 [Nymphon striatum]|nr:NFX1-type zinc finger-containing protein 1 [Nymphon striatum]
MVAPETVSDYLVNAKEKGRAAVELLAHGRVSEVNSLRPEMKMLLIFAVMSWALLFLFIDKSRIGTLMKLCLPNNELKYPSYCDEFSRIPYKFTINASDVCKNHPDIQILLAVYSTPNHRNRRDEIRRGWGSTRLYNMSHTKIIFVLGSSPNSTINESLRRESALYGDIIQQSYMESYFNLSLKARSWIEWTAKYCPEAKFAGKTDDDIFVDIVALSNLFENLTYKHRSNSSAIPDPNNLIFGHKWDDMPVIRNMRSKYGLTLNEYWENHFIEYCSVNEVTVTTNVTCWKCGDEIRNDFMLEEEQRFSTCSALKVKVSTVQIDTLSKRLPLGRQFNTDKTHVSYISLRVPNKGLDCSTMALAYMLSIICDMDNYGYGYESSSCESSCSESSSSESYSSESTSSESSSCESLVTHLGEVPVTLPERESFASLFGETIFFSGFTCFQIGVFVMKQGYLIKIFPRGDELMKNIAPSIQSNKVHSTYTDLEEYLDIQFRLLREDFIAPLREVVSTCNKVRNITKLKENKICRSSIFENLIIIDEEKTNFGTVYWLDLSAHRQKLIDFENSKRFLGGNIVCIFNRTFTTMRICTIYDKMVSGRRKKTLMVGIIGKPHGAQDSLKQSYILVESPAFYKAYSPVLKQLQKLRHIPFERNILYCSKKLNPPAYLTKETSYDITAIMKDEPKQSIEIDALILNESCTGQSVKIFDCFSWTFVKDISLNDSQLQALRHCLTRELAIVQGPPGTGKTFLAIKLAQILLANRKVWSNSGGCGALLIVCQTNHAVDQFLEGILKFNDNIIRIGKRCKSKTLNNKLLHRIMSGDAFEDMESEKKKEIEHLQDITKYIEEAVIGIETFVEFGIITKDIASGINDYGGIWKLLNIKSPNAVVEKAKAEVTNEIDQLKNKKIKGKKGKMKEVDIKMKLTRRRPLADEKVVKILEKSKTVELSEEYFENQKCLYLTKNTSFQVNSEFWYDLKELCKTHPMSEYYIDILATPIENNDNNKKSKKWQNGNKEDSERAKIEKKGTNVILSLGEIYERVNPNVKHELSLSNQDIMTTNEAVDPLLLSEKQRWRFYRSVMAQLQKEIAKKLGNKPLRGNFVKHPVLLEMNTTCWIMILYFQTEKCTNELNKILDQKKLHENISEQDVISSAEVIGMTTTGAAQFASSLEDAFVPIVIVEEASEVLEAQIIAALNKNVQHLIMIGDHKQLRPSPASFNMADKHNLDISFFERMILNGLDYDQLLMQRRMRPEISQLIHPHIYKNLENDLSVMEYPNVRGVGKNVFFVNHSFEEEKLDDDPSKINLYEAEMVLELARYLILQGYSPDRITILTTYIYVVDNYQGEENDIILLTLVRSNKHKSIGFLEIENRVCVALSRAKIGFYCFGKLHLGILICYVKLVHCGQGIIETLKESSLYGEELPLYCQEHVEKFILVKHVLDFKLAPQGRCNVKCNYVLNCGHLCTRTCHGFNSSHEKFICKESCEKVSYLLISLLYLYIFPILSCPLHHTCLRKCHLGEECGLCRTIVEKKIPDCGHTERMQCYVDPEDFDCQTAVYRKIPSCGHTQNMACCEDLKTFVCESICLKKLACGHSCKNKCGEECTEHCAVMVFSKCRQDHKISKKCSTLEYRPCKKVIEKSLPLCGHIQMIYVKSFCGHRVKIKCTESVNSKDMWNKCTAQCQEVLSCGHLCSGKSVI